MVGNTLELRHLRESHPIGGIATLIPVEMGYQIQREFLHPDGPIVFPGFAPCGLAVPTLNDILLISFPQALPVRVLFRRV